MQLTVNRALSSKVLIEHANPDPVIWVRHNPQRLSSADLAWVRGTKHLAEDDVVLDDRVYHSLVRHGHRYIGELEFLCREELLDMVTEGQIPAIRKELARHSTHIGCRRKGGGRGGIKIRAA